MGRKKNSGICSALSRNPCPNPNWQGCKPFSFRIESWTNVRVLADCLRDNELPIPPLLAEAERNH